MACLSAPMPSQGLGLWIGDGERRLAAWWLERYFDEAARMPA